MEVHYSNVSPATAKRLWSVVRITFFMIKKGLVSKRKLIMDMNLMIKRGKLLRDSLSNLISHHHHSKHGTRGSFGVHEYEFSCSNSPNPVFSHVSKRRHHYFPCINSPEVTEEEAGECEVEHKAVALVPKTPDYAFNFRSPFSVRVSNYSSEVHENDNGQVDDDAEEFIRRFYEQLRNQNRLH